MARSIAQQLKAEVQPQINKKLGIQMKMTRNWRMHMQLPFLQWKKAPSIYRDLPNPFYNAFFFFFFTLRFCLRFLRHIAGMDDRPISAVILDLDGTLLDTEHATKNLVKELLVRYGKVVDLDKENKRPKMGHRLSTIAIVKDYDLPITPEQYSQIITPMYHEKWLQAKALPGVNRLIKHLRKHGVPYALASNSRMKSIEIKVSSQKGWKEYFSVIVGSEEVKAAKPSPDIFLEAANKMGVDASCCLVIEDTMAGIKAGKAANMQVVAVPSIQIESDQYSIADHVIHSLLDFQPELWALPPFDDWVMKALPIEPIHFKGSYENGFVQESSDIGASYLVGQAWGVYFGWVEVDSQERLKIVVNIRWDHTCGAFRRNIQACIINGSDGQICNQLMEVTLVGYIRGFNTKQNLSTDAQIIDQDKSIAEACLDLAAYHYHQSHA